MNKRLVVIDGNSLINRGYYAIQRPMITKEGIYTQGIYAFLSMLSKIRNDYHPDYMLVAFDRKAPTFRHNEYKDYKAGRKGMPLELAMEMPILKDILDAMGIARFEIDGFEADDIIGTATKMAEDAGFESFVITGDRDALQLASDKTSVIINKRGMTDFKLYDDQAMMDEYGFDHIQFIDYKALRGDTSDNIPGIPGVGDKTATSLIQQFGSLENLIQNLNQVSNAKLRQKIEDGAMSAMMSKRLATIVRTVPMEMDVEDFIIKPEDTEKLIDLYTKLEFKTYLSKLLENAAAAKQENEAVSYNSENTDYPEAVIIKDFDKAAEILRKENSLVVGFDCDDNHTSLPKLFNLQVLTSDGSVYVIVLDDMLTLLKNEFNNKSISGFNLGRLFYYLSANGIDTSGIKAEFDCAIASYVLSPSGKSPGLEDLILSYFHENIVSEQKQLSLFGESDDYNIVPKKLILLNRLIGIQKEEMQRANLDKVFYGIEMPLCSVLASMEADGFSINRNELVAYGEMLKEHINLLEKEIKEMAGVEFNLNSPMQLGNVLFEKLGLPAGKKTTKGYSTNAEILEKLAPDYPIVEKILEYRSYSKLNSTYVEGMLPLIADDSKIHAHFMQTVTATGRISCSEPNLQNIPVRSDLGRKLRKVFTASSEDRILVGADYSQIELRVLAHMSGDQLLINAFNEGHDIHKETASKVFGVPLDEVTSQMRSNAKAVNFGVIYGMSQYGLSSELTISRQEAEKYINDYFERFSDVKKFLDSCVYECRKTGEIRTMFGRRRVVPEINATKYMVRQLGERLAMNTPIQGTAADIIKMAMVLVRNRLVKECPEAKLILQIHDELIIDTPKDCMEKTQTILTECMENAVELAVKLEVSQNAAYNWYDLK